MNNFYWIKKKEHVHSCENKQIIRIKISWLLLANYKLKIRETKGLESSFTIPDIGIMFRVFANGPGDLGSIPGRVITKTQKMVLDAILLNTQHYKVMIKGKVEQSKKRSSALPYNLV